MSARASHLLRAIRHWEFWPFWLFYVPVYAQLLANGFRSGRLGRFTCANPGIPFGGLLEYSKWHLLAQLPERYCPRTVILGAETSAADAERMRMQAGISYPVYLKPDRGERGLLVERVEDESGLAGYLDAWHAFIRRLRDGGRDPSDERLLLQETAHGEAEFGVLYARIPGAPRGMITSVVEKELLSVTGDGSRSLADLIDAGQRTKLHREQLRAEFSDRLREVPPSGAVIPLVEVGNHVRGATFLDATRHATPELAAIFDRLAGMLAGFYIGRFDVRCESVEALNAGAFQVVEVNGVNSEPAHIYDPSNRLISAYRDLLRHWRLVERIGAANARNGCRVVAARDLLRAIRRHAGRRSAA